METLGRYRLEARIGWGGSSEVWRARRTDGLGDPVAVKRARSGAGEQLRREAEVLTAVAHPHVVRLVDVVDDGDGVALVMAWAEGGSLADLLRERGPLTPGEAVAVLAPIAEALDAAHARGVVHGDLDPSNVLLTGEGVPLLADLGAARRLGGDDGARPGGGPGAAAPSGPSGVAPAVADDVAGLAALAHRCLLGCAPGPEPMPRVGAGGCLPPAVARALASGLAPAAEDRPTSAGALLTAFRAAVPPGMVTRPGCPSTSAEEAVAAGTHRGGTTRPFGPRPPRPDPSPSARRPLALAVAGTAVAVAAAVALWPEGPTRSPSPAAASPADPGPSVPCPDPDPLEVPPGAQELHGDLAGDGCPTQVVWDGRVLRSRGPDGRPRAYRVDDVGPGAAQLLLGDWDCDGDDAPALYRPDVGRISLFAALPGAVGSGVAPRTVDGAPRHGRARRVPLAGAGSCDRVVVDPEA